MRERPSLFNRLGRCVRRLAADPRGATAVEYGLIVSLIVIAMLSALSQLGKTTSGLWNNVANKVGSVN